MMSLVPSTQSPMCAPDRKSVISRTVKFPDATLEGKPITTYDSTHKGAGAYRQLARELIARGGAA